MSLSAVSVSRPVTTLMFYVGVVILGWIAFRNLAVDFLPPVQLPRLNVVTLYPDIPPAEIETNITQPLEAALGTVGGVKSISSTTRDGISIISMQFYWGTDIDYATLEVREKLDQARSLFPRDAGRPNIVRIDPSDESIMTIGIMPRDTALTGTARQSAELATLATDSGLAAHNASLVEVKSIARALVQRRIEQLEGVSQAKVIGGLEREIDVLVDMARTQSLGISLDEVTEALHHANVNLPGGSLRIGQYRYAVRTIGELVTLQDIRSVVVRRLEHERAVTIGDLATVVDTFATRTGMTRFNGSEMIAVDVRKEAGANTVDVCGRVREAIERLRQEYPRLGMTVIKDQSQFIALSVRDVEGATLIGAFLAFIILFIFLREIRYPLIIGLTMPISILATLICMYFLNINLNIISLTGLALGIGMLGDNAIMVVENITRIREGGAGLIESAIEGAKSINLAVTASTFTNVAVFLPIVFVQGVASQLFASMGLTMTISLLVSLLVATTLVPSLLARLRSVRGASSPPGGGEDGTGAPAGLGAFFPPIGRRLLPAVNRMRQRVHRLREQTEESLFRRLDVSLDWMFAHRKLVLLGTLGLLLLSIIGAATIPSESAPDIDQRRLTLEVNMPKGTTLEYTAAFVRRIERELLRMKNVESVYTTIGMTDAEETFDVQERSLERAEIDIRSKQGAAVERLIQDVRMYLSSLQQFSEGVEYVVKRRGTTFEKILKPSAYDISIRIFGNEPRVSLAILGKLMPGLRAIEGLVDIRTADQLGNPEYRLSVDRDAAARYGITVKTIAEYIARQVKGIDASYVSEFDKKITIKVKPGAEHIDQPAIARILSSVIHTAAMDVPVRSVLHYDETLGYQEIQHENQQRAIVVYANAGTRSVTAIADDIDRLAASMKLPEGYRIAVGGENEEIRESFRSLVLVVILSLFLVYMILAAEYESILYPMVILLTSPLAFIGVIAAMLMAGQHYNVISIIGVVIMIGAVDNDAVILVDIVTVLRRQGMGITEAIKSGMRLRIRPILMTTASSVLGIIPLVFDFGSGSELVRALSIPLAGGLLASTFFTIIAIPLVYSYVDRWSLGRMTR